MTLPIPSNVFADGQRVDEAGLYAKVFTPINTIYATQQAQVYIVGSASGTTDTSGYLIITHGLPWTPSLVICTPSGAVSGTHTPFGLAFNYTSTTFQQRWALITTPGTALSAATPIASFKWVAFR